MHNNIMAAGSKDRPPMLGPGRYSQKCLPAVPEHDEVDSTKLAEENKLDPEPSSEERKCKRIGTPWQSILKKLYQPTQQQLRTSSTPGTDEDTTPGHRNNSRQSRVVQLNWDTVHLTASVGAYAKECRKPKGFKDYARMIGYEDTDDEIGIEQEWKNIFSYMTIFWMVSLKESNLCRMDDSNVTPDSSNICNNDNQVDQNAAECVDERAALANLIANLTLDTEENKTILKQLKKANASLLRTEGVTEITLMRLG
ncbi:hypothetical protein Tco_1055297 [Tanacetum coccineum]|uniref:Uncharacterized protein n=1 Tax=Tanacetum coccineum TaxID=301880 RepID=A0ABQ5H0N8_9ASTR